MSQPGMGVMIGMLSGNADSVEAYNGALGKEIASVTLDDEETLRFKFTDGTGLRVADEGQSCCESRYMRTDDDLSHFAGATLTGMEIKEGPEEEEGEYGDVHEVQFLEVTTSKGSFQMASHNEHNGYYGGFWIQCHAEANAC